MTHYTKFAVIRRRDDTGIIADFADGKFLVMFEGVGNSVEFRWYDRNTVYSYVVIG